MSRRDAQRIEDILESCSRLLGIVSGGRDEFVANEVLQDAACYRLTVIGEALNNLSQEFTAQRPGLRIPEARGMRNRLTHEYYDIDVEVLWDTLTSDIAELQQALAGLAEPSRAADDNTVTEKRNPHCERGGLDLF
ncbi:MAG: DUF86 domain-containing protein [Acidimicrobiaceae bacterium]|nr:DUF86 domain-containing protein [Acidimicrobiaceae bacterium]